jgi:hypothetical protein
MGGGGSKEPDRTANENNADAIMNYLNTLKNIKAVCAVECVGVNSAGVCIRYENICKKPNTKDPTTKKLLMSWNIFSAVPGFEREANKINQLKDYLEKWFPEAVSNHLFENDNETVKMLIQKLVERMIERKKKEGFDKNIRIQYDTISYYNDVVIKSGNLIDKKYIGMVSSLNKSLIYHISPPANIDSESMRWSEALYNYINGYLIEKVKAQFQIHGVVQPGDLSGDKMLMFMNACVKVIEDKDLDKYNDDTQITGVSIVTYDDEQLKNNRIFDDLESLKGACKLILFCYRKKNCMKYMDPKNKTVPDYTTFRQCKISGVEPLIKPQEELDRIEANKDKSSEPFTIESPNVEKFVNRETKNIFGEVEKNLKLVFGYVLVLFIIGILLYVSPSIATFLYNVISVILVQIAQYAGIVGTLFVSSIEGLVTGVVQLITFIVSAFGIVFGISANVITDLLTNVINTLGLIFNISSNVVSDIIANITGTAGMTSQVSNNVVTDMIKSIMSIISLIFEVSYKVVSDIFTNTFQSFMIVITSLFQGSTSVIQNFLEFIFNKLKKYYMFINNIVE